MKYLLLVLLQLTFIIFALSQGQPHYKHFLTNDGLPSREVYVSCQDDEGNMWFGTDNGIVKFDGYQMKVVSPSNVFEDNIVNTIFNENGKLWFGSMYGDVFYYENEKFIPYKYNSIIHQYKGRFVTATIEKINEEGDLYLSLFDLGILHIDKNGNENLIGQDNELGFVTKEVGNQVFGTRTTSLALINNPQNAPVDINFSSYDNNNNFKTTKIPKIVGGSYRVFNQNLKLTKGKIFCYGVNLKYAYHHQIYKTQINKMVNQLYFHQNGKVYICFGDNFGLGIAENINDLINAKYITYFKGNSFSNIYFDTSGGMWLTSTNNGIFYVGSNLVKIWNNENGLKNEQISCIKAKDKNNCYFSNGIAEIKYIDGEKVISLPKFPINVGFCQEIAIFHDRVYAYAGFYKKGKWNLNSYQDKSKYFIFRNASIDSTSDLMWVNNLRGFALLNLKTNRILLSHNLYKNRFVRVFDVLADHHHAWIATQEGLKYFNGKVVIDSFTRKNPLLSSRTNCLAQFKDGRIILGTKDKGILIYDKQNVEIIDDSKGMADNQIRHLQAEGNNIIWAATNNGLHKITIGNNNQMEIRIFNESHGLPTNEIIEISKTNDVIWIATNKGLVRFLEPPINYLSPTPKLVSLKVNNQKNEIKNSKGIISFNYNQNNFQLKFLTTNFKLCDKIKYRIKNNIDKNWRYTSNPQLELLGLAPGIYNYEFQSANEDQIWSKSTNFEFKITPPWWKSWYFYFALTFIGVITTYGIIKYRTDQVKREIAFDAKISQLEKVALQSQMNPHFISNAFSSLQYFIHSKNMLAADEYLTDLSSLLRKILENSRQAEVSLKQELDLINIYLHLEKIRFDHKFNSEIKIQNGIDLQTTVIPTMMLQPIVENAINHGLHHLENRAGIIFIDISQLNDQLTIMIEDNGIGRKKAKKYNESKHKSFGLDILNDRITAYNKTTTEQIKFQIIDKENDEGTIVKLSFVVKDNNSKSS